MRIAIALVVLAGMARLAAAECAVPRTLISPASGAELPPDPTIYVFRGAYEPEGEIAVTRGGQRLDTEQLAIGSSNAWSVVRVKIHAGPGPIDISYTNQDLGDRPAHYTVGSSAPPDLERLIAGEAVDDQWTCSFTRGVRLDVSGNAVAFRLEAAADVTALRAGRYETAYLYPRPDELRAHGAADAITIGHLSCRGDDIPDGMSEALRDTGAYVRLVALYADGREHAEELGFLRITDRAIDVPDWYAGMLDLSVPGAAHPVALDVFDGGRGDTPDMPWLAMAASAGGGAATMLVTLALLTRRRRRARGVVGRL